ncbi:MAG: hypothetical protein H7122_13690 [Chitinophagaceae bacterium]|nr:hypothetical protein [Chitinophagaceae bacterium]
MERFLPQQDELSHFINSHALALYQQLQSIRVEDLKLDTHYLEYFRSSHYKRLFFSIETSAQLLYRGIVLKKKPASDIVIMDYGAGIGTLFILAKMIGCKKVIYNDLFEDWKYSAQEILRALGMNVDEYIVGDIDSTLEKLATKQIQCDIIASRNVMEHIYKIDVFFAAIHKHQPTAIIYSSTTANYYNPATHIQHVMMHRRYESVFLQQRKELIMKNSPSLSASVIDKVSKKTRGLGADEFSKVAIDPESYNHLYPVKKVYTNTCDPYNGVWAEHLMPFSQYRMLIGSQYSIRFEPGFWDTHYNRRIMNVLAGIFNAVIRMNKTIGIMLAPFIYVIAIPRQK